MITWKMYSAGNYMSSDRRFEINKTFNRLHGNHWVLFDNEESKQNYERWYKAYTLKECKEYAQKIIEKEENNND